ncbi:G-type lectin S-receptor-like serine/threonine-protein kinase At4g27290 [Pistacia vera]|uniref:G-type lectin S-receptor-like serine/threonine-protein kinase At4g27290 n=1 Tax=Pistacia vera TaxID=55513 RepID=UPI001262BFED|nr:G-type lectin S-receptor-like serine/threonine-protein kinase At4g27290 [Pistacia vera]
MRLARSGPWNGIYFGLISSDPDMSIEPILVDNQDEICYTYKSYNNPTIMLLKLNKPGPSDPCGHYGNCGTNTDCSNNKTHLCECLKGFKLKSQHNQTWPKTFVTSYRFDCKSEGKFMKLSGIKLPDFLEVSPNESMNLRDSDAKCLKNCSCRNYAISDVTGGGSGYLMWFGDLIDIKKITNGMDVYIRM